MNLQNFNNFIINENFKTYSLKKIFNFLRKTNLTQSFDFYTNGLDTKLYIPIRPKYKNEYKNIISKLENFYGWYLSTVNKYNGVLDKNVNYYKEYIEYYIEDFSEDDIENAIGILEFEPKYDRIIPNSDIPDKIYHITEENLYSKIKKIGLIPKHLDRISYHPDRIFFGLSESICINLSSHEDFKIKNPILLIIDSKSLKEKNISFYDDSNLSDAGIYVIDNIPPKYIIGMKLITNND
jgi:hypothetical protein